VQTPDPNVAASAAFALTAAAVAAGTDWNLLNIPPVVYFACASGAMFGATWFEPEKRVSKPWAMVTFFSAGLVMGTGIAEVAKLGLWMHATAGFVASAFPVLMAQKVKDLVFSAIDRVFGKRDGTS
jgi:hypothetical protein